MTDSLRSLVVDGGVLLSVDLTEEQLEKIQKYVKLLVKWNARISLTAARDDREIVSRHVLDSLAVVPHVPDGAGRLVDVGSGGGLPGAIIAIVRPDVSVVALEPIRKKHAFLSALRREVPLRNFDPVAERLEQHVAGSGFEGYDVAVSRATWRIDEWLVRARAVVRGGGGSSSGGGGGGRIIGMEGAERHELPDGASRHPYELGDRTRAIVVLEVRE